MSSWAIGLSTLLVVGGGSMSVARLQNQGVNLPGLSATNSLLAMLDARSPGERKEGVLSQTKHKHASQALPTERALGRINHPRENTKAFTDAIAKTPTDTLLAAAPDVPLAAAIVPIELSKSLPVLGGALVPAASSVGGSGFIGGGGGSGGGTGGGTGGTGGGTTETPVVTTVTPGVPEPATWLTMLVGFAGIGVSMRRQRNSGALSLTR